MSEAEYSREQILEQIERCDQSPLSATWSRVGEMLKQLLAESKPASGDFSIGSDNWPGIGKLIEECGEVGQVCGKLIGTGGRVEHWDGTNLRERLEDELGDLLAASAFVVSNNGLSQKRIIERQKKKLALFRKWHEEAAKP